MKRKTLSLLITVLLGFTLFSAAPTLAQDDGPQETQAQAQGSQTVLDIIRTDPRLESFQLLVQAAGLSDNLAQDGPFTVFAPTNEALAQLDELQKSAAVAGDATPTDILLYHIVNGSYTSAAIANQRAIQTLEGSRLFFDVNTDSASGEQTTMLNEVGSIVEADIPASNGVVHIVDRLAPLPAQGTIFSSQVGSAQNTMYEVLAGDGRFDTFLSLVDTAGLEPLLDNPFGRYTLFAPTDEAFNDVPDEMLDGWLADPAGALHTILSYHIVTDRLSINQIATDEYLPTMEGRAIVVTTGEDRQVYLNGSPVQSANMVAANGVIHVVDRVVLP